MAFDTKYVRFEGSDEHVTMSDVLGFERSDSFSFSEWVRCTVFTSTRDVIAKYLGSPTYQGYQFAVEVATGKLYFFLCNTYSGNNYIELLSDAAGLNDGAWHHVVVTYNGSSLAAGVLFYVDGAAVGKTVTKDTLSATTITTAPFCIGANPNNLGGAFVGGIDEVAVYNKVLSGSEVTWIYNNGAPNDLLDGGAPSNLVAWWRMGEGDTYPTLLDQTTNNYDGTMTNMESSDICSGPGSIMGVDGGGVPLGFSSGSMEHNRAGLLAALAVGLPPGVVVKYIKRARDLGSSPSFFTEWVTTDISSAPPTSPPVGPWGEIKILGVL